MLQLSDMHCKFASARISEFQKVRDPYAKQGPFCQALNSIRILDYARQSHPKEPLSFKKPPWRAPNYPKP